jgi:calcium-dependent protein kinase
MGESEKIRLKYEIDILKNLIHPNIVRLYEVYEDKNSIFLVTELCDGRELFDEIIARGRFIEQEAAIVTKQMLQAIAYCHENNVAHRDLKPENILIDYKSKGSIKVIDFGTSHVFQKEANVMHQMYGTAYYIAPEVLAGAYTEKCDVWSIGVILYVMLSGKPPFNGRNDREILAKV